MRSICDSEEFVRKSDVTYTLNKITDISKEDNRLEPVIEYNQKLEEIIINDSYFAFSMYCDAEDLIFSENN